MTGESDRREARIRFIVLTAIGLGTLLFLLPVRSFAAQDDCAQPVSTGAAPVASHCTRLSAG